MVEGLFFPSSSLQSPAYPLRLFLLFGRKSKDPVGRASEWFVKRTILQQRKSGYSSYPMSVCRLVALLALLPLSTCYKLGEEKERERDLFRDKSALDPPSPIPNLEVKQYSADGTTAARLWESRPLRGDLFTLFLLPLSLINKKEREGRIGPSRSFLLP